MVVFGTVFIWVSFAVEGEMVLVGREGMGVSGMEWWRLWFQGGWRTERLWM